jgi:ATP-dependent Lhr-like helicase
LTTPESIEGMLISTKVDHRALFAGVRTVVVDEVHAFAGDDRGWHLLAVLARLQRLAGREVQRLGLSATVGNPAELLAWLTQGCTGPAVVVVPQASPSVPAPAGAEVLIDHVGSTGNAAIVISRLHRGDKRLVFADSRKRVEELSVALRGLGVTTTLSHSSLSVDERRRAESAFAEGRDCVIVATSTLELGIDVGDLDRVIQIDAPSSVASFLQRLGRTGRRPGTTRNTLFLTTGAGGLLEAAALTRLWASDWVEPVVAPPEPWHLLAQQLLALALQEGQVGASLWPEWFEGLGGFGPGSPEVAEVLAHLVERGLLYDDAGMLSVGPDGERSFGAKNFLELTSVFTADPLVEVIAGVQAVGHVNPLALERRGDGEAPVLLLAGRTWVVEHVDWRRRRAWVRETAGKGRSIWGGNPRGLSAAVAGSIRSVLAGSPAGAALSARAAAQLEVARQAHPWVREGETTLVASADPDVDDRWWTFAGLKANAELAARLGSDASPESLWLRVPAGTSAADLRRLASVALTRPSPIMAKLAADLKFAQCLPPALAASTARARMADPEAVERCLGEPVVTWTG